MRTLGQKQSSASLCMFVFASAVDVKKTSHNFVQAIALSFIIVSLKYLRPTMAFLGKHRCYFLYETFKLVKYNLHK